MKKLVTKAKAHKRFAGVVVIAAVLLIAVAIKATHSGGTPTDTVSSNGQNLPGTTVAQTEQAIATNPKSRAALLENPGPAEAAADHAPNGLEGDPYHPVQGTQTVNLTVQDGRLVSGPSTVNAKVGDYVLFRITDDRDDRSFFVNDLGIHAEVEEADEGGGTAYLKLDRVGSFAYGVQDEANPDDSQTLGTLTVSQ